MYDIKLMFVWNSIVYIANKSVGGIFSIFLLGYIYFRVIKI